MEVVLLTSLYPQRIYFVIVCLLFFIPLFLKAERDKFVFFCFFFDVYAA